jgi:hypothetical protein
MHAAKRSAIFSRCSIAASSNIPPSEVSRPPSNPTAKCTLLAFVDDATSRLMHLRFVASESAVDYFRATRSYLEMHGKPIAFYSDKHGIFRVNAKDAAGGDRATQFGVP